MEDRIITHDEINERAAKIVKAMNAAFPGEAGSSENIYAMVCVALATAMKGVKSEKEFYDRLGEVSRCMGDYAISLHESYFPEMYVDANPTNATRH